MMEPVKNKFNQSLKLYTPLLFSYQKTNYSLSVRGLIVVTRHVT